jgi:C-terminal processing protease CtpA/Prc
LSTKREHEYLQLTFHDPAHPGAFYWKKDIWTPYTEEQIANSRKYNGKIIVLISEVSFSAAETAAVMYRTAGNAILIGRLTAGANGNIAQLLLPNKVYAYFSGLGAYYPDRTEIQRKGVIPNIEVYPDMQSILEGRDEILERAISYINEL